MPDPLAPASEPLATLPNALTLAGLGCSAVWLAGGSGWWAIAGLVLDELDGRVARFVGQTSEFGSAFDWAGDVAMTGAVAVKLGKPALYVLPVAIAAQAALRNQGWRPPIGSARAVLTLWALAQEGFFRRDP